MGEWAGETVGPDVWETCRELIMYPSVNGRPSTPPQILATAITSQALHGLPRFETVQGLRCDLHLHELTVTSWYPSAS